MSKENTSIIIHAISQAKQKEFIQFLNQVSTYDETLFQQHQEFMANIGVDYAVLDIDQGLDLHLWGLPSYQYNHTDWKELYAKSLGILFLLDIDLTDEVNNMQAILDFFRQQKKTIIFGLSGQETITSQQISDLSTMISVPTELLIPCNTKNLDSIKNLASTLFNHVKKHNNICRRQKNHHSDSVEYYTNNNRKEDFF
ncbi:MAG: hypothetical protein Q9M28_11250 [Mariprofundaceae bacterium]|nr:hypothetical protein [Mariprofundaceae bacterium]